MFHLSSQLRKGVYPSSLHVLEQHLKRIKEKESSFYLSYFSVKNDLFGKSVLYVKENGKIFKVYRTGCFPFIKFFCILDDNRCTKSLIKENYLLGALKVLNFGVSTLAYGIASIFLIRDSCFVTDDKTKSKVKIYFQYQVDGIGNKVLEN
jgi:hypothetical protein